MNWKIVPPCQCSFLRRSSPAPASSFLPVHHSCSRWWWCSWWCSWWSLRCPGTKLPTCWFLRCWYLSLFVNYQGLSLYFAFPLLSASKYFGVFATKVEAPTNVSDDEIDMVGVRSGTFSSPSLFSSTISRVKLVRNPDPSNLWNLFSSNYQRPKKPHNAFFVPIISRHSGPDLPAEPVHLDHLHVVDQRVAVHPSLLSLATQSLSLQDFHIVSFMFWNIFFIFISCGCVIPNNKYSFQICKYSLCLQNLSQYEDEDETWPGHLGICRVHWAPQQRGSLRRTSALSPSENLFS